MPDQCCNPKDESTTLSTCIKLANANIDQVPGDLYMYTKDGKPHPKGSKEWVTGLQDPKWNGGLRKPDLLKLNDPLKDMENPGWDKKCYPGDSQLTLPSARSSLGEAGFFGALKKYASKVCGHPKCHCGVRVDTNVMCSGGQDGEEQGGRLREERAAPTQERVQRHGHQVHPQENVRLAILI